MFFYGSNSKFPGNIEVKKLTDQDSDLITQAAIWFKEKWGWAADFPSLEKRKEMLKSHVNPPNALYMLMYAGLPVGMFILDKWTNVKSHEKLHLDNALELDSVYVEQSFRGLGLGGFIVRSAKEIAKSDGADLIILDTLTPALNHFYERHGAKVVCEGRYFQAATDILQINLRP
ncbi:MAG TPA: GNAT family N-acetyltransferase [Gammaproteobacteria bacterium]|jgi:GNAT superfamily N-acetyltransferase|nr:GNAT family N-acetyltransferase [Gammaproteobacteria bacterium]